MQHSTIGTAQNWPRSPVLITSFVTCTALVGCRECTHGHAWRPACPYLLSLLHPVPACKQDVSHYCRSYPLSHLSLSVGFIDGVEICAHALAGAHLHDNQADRLVQIVVSRAPPWPGAPRGSRAPGLAWPSPRTRTPPSSLHAWAGLIVAIGVRAPACGAPGSCAAFLLAAPAASSLRGTPICAGVGEAEPPSLCCGAR